MCSGGSSKKREAEREQKRLEKKAERRQKELDRLAREREQLVVEQEQRQNELQAQLATQQRTQRRTVRGLQADQAERVGSIRAAGNAAASSLRMLSESQPTAPTAAITQRGANRKGAASTSAKLARGSGRTTGVNLSI